MTKARSTTLIIGLALLLAACNRDKVEGGGLQQLRQQRVGEYLVDLLNSTGQLKQGSNQLVLEFRMADNNRLTDPGNVQTELAMPMQGMPEMKTETSLGPSGQPGRYNVTANFAMGGTWRLAVTFGSGRRVQFDLEVP